MQSENFQRFNEEFKQYAKKLREIIGGLIREECVLVKSKHARWREDNEEIVVAEHPLVGITTFMNPTMAMIFKLCDGTNSLKKIDEYMSSAFHEVEPRIISTDVKNSVAILFTNGFIELQMPDGTCLSYSDIVKTFPPPRFIG